MNDRTLIRMTAYAGIATTVMTVVAFAIFGTLSPPALSDSAVDVATFFADHQTVLYVLVWIASLSLGTDLVLLAGLREVVRRRANEQAIFASIGLVSGGAFLTVLFFGLAIVLQLAYRHGTAEADVQRSLFDLYIFTTAIKGVPLALFVSAFSIALMRGKIVPDWISWYGFFVAMVHLVSVGSLARTGSFTPDIIAGFVAPLILESWVLGVSVLLLRYSAAIPD